MKHDPLIVTIKRHSLEDGPGIRSVVFFKGCPLRCVFCHNPEAQELCQELSFSAKECIACGQCHEACREIAIDMSSRGRIDRDRCSLCGDCAKACPTGALRLIGDSYGVDELIDVLLRDRPYYYHSGGGVTLSGGEPTLYPDFLCRLLRKLKSVGVHTCLETCGYFDYGDFSRKVLPYLDLIFFDLKLIDPDRHSRYTGKSNKLILRNLARLQTDRPASLQVRVPLIPGITATSENLGGIRDFLSEIGIRTVVLLPYNPLGINGLVKLGRQPVLQLPESLMTTAEEDQALSSFLSSNCFEKGIEAPLRSGGPSGPARL